MPLEPPPHSSSSRPESPRALSPQRRFLAPACPSPTRGEGPILDRGHAPLPLWERGARVARAACGAGDLGRACAHGGEPRRGARGLSREASRALSPRRRFGALASPFHTRGKGPDRLRCRRARRIRVGVSAPGEPRVTYYVPSAGSRNDAMKRAPAASRSPESENVRARTRTRPTRACQRALASVG